MSASKQSIISFNDRASKDNKESFVSENSHVSLTTTIKHMNSSHKEPAQQHKQIYLPLWIKYNKTDNKWLILFC